MCELRIVVVGEEGTSVENRDDGSCGDIADVGEIGGGSGKTVNDELDEVVVGNANTAVTVPKGVVDISGTEEVE